VVITKVADFPLCKLMRKQFLLGIKGTVAAIHAIVRKILKTISAGYWKGALYV
jgi:hypothetical protein